MVPVVSRFFPGFVTVAHTSGGPAGRAAAHRLRLGGIHHGQQVLFTFLFFASPGTNRISRPDLFPPSTSERPLRSDVTPAARRWRRGDHASRVASAAAAHGHSNIFGPQARAAHTPGLMNERPAPRVKAQTGLLPAPLGPPSQEAPPTQAPLTHIPPGNPSQQRRELRCRGAIEGLITEISQNLSHFKIARTANHKTRIRLRPNGRGRLFCGVLSR